MSEVYEILAVKYAERLNRTRAESFINADDHLSPHPMDYYVWVVRNAQRTIVVDTGFDQAGDIGVRRRRNRVDFGHRPYVLRLDFRRGKQSGSEPHPAIFRGFDKIPAADPPAQGGRRYRTSRRRLTQVPAPDRAKVSQSLPPRTE